MIGSTVNPALGRIDYSPIVQGAQSAAQGIQNAGQITGQMYSNLGSTIGNQLTTSVQQYQKNKEERDFYERTGFHLEELFEAEIEKFSKDGFLEYVGGRLRLSERGLFVADEILSEFV